MASDLMVRPPINAWTNRTIEYAAFGALAIQIWEFASSFFDEAEYLYWTRFTLVKLLYIWSRYIPLLAQIVNLALTHKMYESPLQAPALSCTGLFVYKTVVAQQTLNCVEVILLIRVYALYNQSRRVKYILYVLFITSCSLETWSNVRIIASLIEGQSCNPVTIKSSTAIAMTIFCASAAFFQVCILCMTIFKYIVGHHYGWARTPLTSLMLRDGTVVCFLIFGMLVLNMVYEKIREFGLGLALWDTSFAWYISLLSVTGCRLILDMRKLAVSQTRSFHQDYEIEFTSNLELSRS